MKITRDDLIEWIDRSPSNSDLEMCKYIIDLQESRLKAIEYIKRFDIEHLHECMEHNVAEVLEDLNEILGGKE